MYILAGYIGREKKYFHKFPFHCCMMGKSLFSDEMEQNKVLFPRNGKNVLGRVLKNG